MSPDLLTLALYASMLAAVPSMFFGLRTAATALLASALFTEALNQIGVGYTPTRWFLVDCAVIGTILGICVFKCGARGCWRKLGWRSRFILMCFGFIWASYVFPRLAAREIEVYAMIAQFMLTLPWPQMARAVHTAYRRFVETDRGGWTSKAISYV